MRITETRDKKQAVLVIGFRGTTVRDADRYPLELLQEACSDLGSRLFMRIREKLGLAYYVGAQNVLGLAPGYFAFYAGTEPDKASQVETELLNEAELLRTEGLPAEELLALVFGSDVTDGRDDSNYLPASVAVRPVPIAHTGS